ncbi:hypothetical protein E3T43_07195 [Cryobacterium sp. Hh7]|uniref:hypothetical protein n=1 Tax=Cryobacterium sp. Hh7 TaxID=1259159 RepID=UPI00106BD406|nr:hypothetical protein [Cryobacterium sp. Hh7]TFD58026.1 hypothetical protein E3T43_07195 [Cryobacterium sp. Hh7]
MAAAAVLLLAGCSSAVPVAAPVAETVDVAPEASETATPEAAPEATPEAEVAECIAVAQSTVNAINVGVAGIEPANNITSAVAVRAGERENVWFVAATINGEGMTDVVGLWATNDDITVDPYSGSMFSVNGEASAFSDWGTSDFSSSEAGADEALDCVS